MIGESLNLLEGENDRLLYLPAITLGYLFTITGSSVDFALAVVLVAGGRALSDIVGRFEDRDGELEGLPTEVWRYVEDKHQGFVTLLGLILLLYGVGTVKGWYLLYKLFDHTDLVIVGISIGYCAVFIIVLANSIDGES